MMPGNYLHSARNVMGILHVILVGGGVSCYCDEEKDESDFVDFNSSQKTRNLTFGFEWECGFDLEF